MKVKSIETYICLSLILLNLVSCYNFRSAKQDSEIAFEDQYAKVEVTRISDISFESVNPSWREAKKDSAVSDYPNPFSPSLTYKWYLIEPDSIHLSLWDNSGRMICSLYEAFLEEGLYEMKFIETNLNSGVYLVRLKKGDEEYIRKTILFRSKQ
jgi:hypothetical protein